MKVLIIGATGMIGHSLWIGLSKIHDVSVLVRKPKALIPDMPNINRSKIFDGINVLDIDKVERVVEQVRPDVVFNCIGIVKQLEISSNHKACIELNSLFPHNLAQICEKLNARMIQFSSDCVFDGVNGKYSESDVPNATDLYGKTKALGEIDYLENVVTLRTSFIGREVFPHGGLVNWFEAQEGKMVKGFSKAIYSGLPTNTFINVLNDFILPNSELHGIYHLSSNPIDKCSLLRLVKDRLGLNISIEEDPSFVIDRSLSSQKLRIETGLTLPDWSELVEDLKVNEEFYRKLNLKSN